MKNSKAVTMKNGRPAQKPDSFTSPSTGLDSITANSSSTRIPPTYTISCTAATKSAARKKYRPATPLKVRTSAKAAWTMFRVITTKNPEPIVMSGRYDRWFERSLVTSGPVDYYEFRIGVKYTTKSLIRDVKTVIRIYDPS